jgi:hypothetical protein
MSTNPPLLRPCATCGNLYDKPLVVTYQDQLYTFDSIECLAHKLAPACHQCGCRILGHGSEGNGALYCCAHCARQAGMTEVHDRVGG